jgi:hypothetical protein
MYAFKPFDRCSICKIRTFKLSLKCADDGVAQSKNSRINKNNEKTVRNDKNTT